MVVVFRALGFVPDKEILEHICYDFEDRRMLELHAPDLTLAHAGVVEPRAVSAHTPAPEAGLPAEEVLPEFVA